MEAVQTARHPKDDRHPKDTNPSSVETHETIIGKQQLYNLLEEADNDVKNGNFLTEEEMEKEMDLM